MINLRKIFYFFISIIFFYLFLTLSLYSKEDESIPDYILKMQKIANEGNAEVQYNLGLIYSNGEGVDKNFSKALYWFKKSASQGNVLAEYKLGYIYDNGLGVKKDPIVAYKY